MKNKYRLACLTTSVLLSATAAVAQTTIADWTFDVSQPTTAGPISPEVGAGAATAVGLTSITDSGGNPSTGKSFSGPGWNVNDYWQFKVSTLGLTGISVSFDQEGSATGPGTFALQYSTDGVAFTQFGSTFSLGTSANTWRSQAIDLSSITDLNNTLNVYFRVVDASATAINGGAVGTGGTSRIDNFVVNASGFSIIDNGAPTVVLDVHNTNAYVGRTISLTVVASGSNPLSYQWYYPNLNTSLADNGHVSGSTSSTLILNNVVTNDTGNYQVVITNASGSITSSIALVTVKVPIATNIAYIRTLQDNVNWAPVDTTNLYTVQGTVTTYINETSGTANGEFYIQDDTGGIAVFVVGNNNIPDAGSLVQVTGPIGQFKGLLELSLTNSNPDHSVSILGSNPLPAPSLFNFASATDIPYMEAHEGSLIVVSNVFLGSTNTAFTANASVTMTNLSGVVFTLFINARQTDVIGQLIPAFAASITGVLGQFVAAAPFTTGYELDVNLAANIVPGTPPTIVPSIPLNIQLSGNNVVLTWEDPSFSLQAAPDLTATFTNIPAATSPYQETVDGQPKYYRLVH